MFTLSKGADDERTRPSVPAPPVDRLKVERVRRAIAAGRYVLDPDRTAATMIKQDLQSR